MMKASKKDQCTTYLASTKSSNNNINDCAVANRIVLVSSMAASAPIAGYSLYAASKSAVRALAHSLDMELS